MQRIQGKKKHQSVRSFIGLKINKLIYKCKECKKKMVETSTRINQKVSKYTGINKLVLLLRKGVYPYEYVDSWERFDETSLPDKKSLYSKL